MIRIPIAKPTKAQGITFALGLITLAVSVFAPGLSPQVDGVLQLLGVYLTGAGTPVK